MSALGNTGHRKRGVIPAFRITSGFRLLERRSEYNFDTPKECLLFTKERKWRAGVVQGGKERYKTFLSYFFKCTL